LSSIAAPFPAGLTHEAPTPDLAGGTVCDVTSADAPELHRSARARHRRQAARAVRLRFIAWEGESSPRAAQGVFRLSSASRPPSAMMWSTLGPTVSKHPG